MLYTLLYIKKTVVVLPLVYWWGWCCLWCAGGVVLLLVAGGAGLILPADPRQAGRRESFQGGGESRG